MVQAILQHDLTPTLSNLWYYAVVANDDDDDDDGGVDDWDGDIDDDLDNDDVDDDFNDDTLIVMILPYLFLARWMVGGHIIQRDYLWTKYA